MSLSSRLPCRSILRAAAWILGALLFLLALAWFGIPPLARSQIEARGTEKLGRAVTVEAVRFVPWKLQTTLDGLQVAGLPGQSAPQLRIDRVQFRTALSSLWVGAPVIEQLRVDKPHVRLARLAGGRYDIDDLIERLVQPAEPASAPARFALHDLKLDGGSADFDDRALSGAKALHTLRNLQLALPTISSLRPGDETEVAPTLSFDLDDSRFDSKATAQPFAEMRKGEVTLQVDGLELARLRDYLPPSLPASPRGGKLDARLTLRFAQQARPADALLDISGDLRLEQLVLAAADDREVFGAQELRIAIGQLAPLRRSVKLDRIELVGPRLDIRRDAAGRIDLLPAASKPASTPSTAPPAAPWKVELAQLAIRDGRLRWQDAAAAEPVAITVDKFGLEASAIAWPMVRPATLRGSASIAGDKTTPATTATLEWSGTAGLQDGQMRVGVRKLPLAWARPYLPVRLQPRLAGVAAGDMDVGWSPEGVQAQAPTVSVEGLALSQAGRSLVGVQRVAVSDLKVDTARRSVSAGRLEIAAPVAQVARDARGRWMFEDWWAAPVAKASKASSSSSSSPTAAAPWTASLKALSLTAGRIGWRDAVPRRSVALDLQALKLQATDLAWPVEAGARGFVVQLDTTLAAGETAPGRLRFNGSVAPSPVVVDGRLDAERLPLQAVEPYFGDGLAVQLVRADMDFAGNVRADLLPAGLELRAQGNASVENGRIDSAAPDSPGPVPVASTATNATNTAARRAGVLTPGTRRANSLFTWRTLQLHQLTLKLAPGKPLFWGVYDTTLADFFARLSIAENGQLNLRQLTRAAAPAGASARSPAAPQPAPAQAPELHFGQIHLSGGRVLFTDNFIKPSYSASLSELQGVLGAFDSVGAVYAEPAMATLNLRGKAEGTASLSIDGKLNPLANPLAVDIVAKVNDLDLPALSPYSVKYMGHGIERGKLSMDVHYRIQPDGKLSADNSLVLRQLAFDEQERGSSSLPVRLAAALLADSNGVIDLNLPISGSINDPQFSLAPVIMKALVNLVTRAVTSPFSLISGLFSGPGQSETSTVRFAAGSAELDASARQGLDAVAKALVARPALQLTVSGAASADAETEGIRRERLRQLARVEKRRAMTTTAPAQSPPPLSQVALSDAEYPALLRRVYEATDMPKPRNFVGMQKDVPLAEMERLLAQQVDVTDDSVRSLALQRAGAVRDYLADHGVPAARVFLGSPRMGDEAAAPPEARLRLSAR
ncbi:DUF748 domain-containing protein [Xylophilus sp. GOD-11R]|uniref:DUF748 domain-containing protein n=1 Tax=Xylophilus sp. GOD-11R TaxID=3089814 RepID=UPI00298CAAAB|nr:DUF748 domain-containing protein [Xylophilus sp. GOD-11R]WPB58008.1 DUF748 domain-containing protein [Xylophilus sp. GOD-11R]